MQVKTLEIKNIVLDAGTQIRVSIDEERVQHYHELLEDDTEFPPVDVFFDGVRYILADGFHRIYAFMRSNRQYIDATIHLGTARDAFLFALKANSKHGLPRSIPDRRNAVNMALDDPILSKESARTIAKATDTSHTFVSNIIKERQGLVKPKEKPVKLKNVVEAPLEVGENPEPEVATLPPEDDMVQELVAENERLQDRLAVSAMDATEDEKAMAQETIDELRQQVKNLTIELEAVKKSRDQYQMECSQLKKQVGMYQRQLKKVS
jgi:FtsZ-binding cell division protein ZapB